MKVINLKNYGVIVMSTEITKEAMLKLMRHNPDSLKLKDENGDEIFAIAYGEASLSDYGMSFDKVDSEGKLLLSISGIMENTEVAEEFAVALTNLKAVEAQALAAYTELEAKLLEVANSIQNTIETPEAEEVQ